MHRLSDFQWHHRLILVNATGGLEDATETLRRRASGIQDRDLVWFVMTGDGVDSNLSDPEPSLLEPVRAVLNEQPEATRVVLIGKDGGIKSRSGQLDLDMLFERIDRMPMRQREMREGS